MNTERKNYYVTKRSGWFNGAYDHVVMSRSLDKILCAGPDHACDVIAHALNMLQEIGDKYK